MPKIYISNSPLTIPNLLDVAVVCLIGQPFLLSKMNVSCQGCFGTEIPFHRPYIPDFFQNQNSRCMKGMVICTCSTISTFARKYSEEKGSERDMGWPVLLGLGGLKPPMLFTS